MSFSRSNTGSASSSSGRDVYGHRPGPKGFKTVIIDAGHGGKDSGAVSSHTRQKEKDLALDTAKRIANSLRGDFKVIMMRSEIPYKGTLFNRWFTPCNCFKFREFISVKSTRNKT